MIISPSENFAKTQAGRHAWCGLLLAIVPGFGQFYHRQWLKGLIFLVLLSSFTGIFYDFLREGIWGYIPSAKKYRAITRSFCWQKGSSAC